MTVNVENGMCTRDLNMRQVRQRHGRRAPTGKVNATKDRKEEKEQEQIRHEVGEGTSKKKKYTKPVESRVDT